METSPLLDGATAKGKKSAQADANPKTKKFLVDISDDNKHDILLNVTTTPTQGKPQSSGTSADPNALDMVLQLEIEPTKEPHVKNFKLVMGIPTLVPLNIINPKEIKRLADLKAAKDKSEEKLRRLTPAQLNAQGQKLTKIESQRSQQLSKSREEFLNCINFRDDQLPITKLKMLGFTKSLELHKLASRKQGDINDQQLNNLKAKFKWVASTADKLNIPTPYQLNDFEHPPAE
ncbi:hypothetical protein Tco_0850809 [Tanacetum coccineum]